MSCSSQNPSYTTTNPLVNTVPCVGGNPCTTQLVSSDYVKYSGPNLPCTNIQTCDTATVALQKADEQICELKQHILILQQLIQNCCTTTTSTTTSVPPSTSTTTSTSSTSSTTSTTSSTSSSTTSTTSSTSSTTSTSTSSTSTTTSTTTQPPTTSTTTSTSSTSSTTSTTSSTTSTSSSTTTSTTTGVFYYYLATPYLDCVQNGAPGGTVLRSTNSTLGGSTSWVCASGIQHQIVGNTTGPTYAYDVDGNIGYPDCSMLPC